MKKSLPSEEILHIFIALRSKGIYADTLHCVERIKHPVNSLRTKMQHKLFWRGVSSGRSRLVPVTRSVFPGKAECR